MTANITEKTAQLKHPNLETVIAKQMFPTPSTRDHKGTNDLEKTLTKLKNNERCHIDQLPNFIMVKENTKMFLNPYWVEALMGLPQGWTALDGTETEMQGTWADGTWEEGIPRVIKGCLNRVDRIRMCGNGVVPQTAALAWKVLSDRLEG